jgi:glutathione S-transferase
MASGSARLFALPGSAPAYSGELMLKHKGIPYRRIDLIPVWHRRMLKALGFPGKTVPALLVDGRKVQTNRAIARALDELVPQRPLFPAEPEARSRVEEVERFADEVVQPLTRRIVLGSLARDPRTVRAHRAIGRLPIPRGSWLRQRMMRPALQLYRITPDQERRDRSELPALLDRLDGCMTAGVLGGRELNAADLEVAPLVAVLWGIRELEPELRGRPVAALAPRVLAM